MGLSLVYGVIAQRTVLCVLWCKTFNDPLHLLTKGMSGCASRIKIGHLFQNKALIVIQSESFSTKSTLAGFMKLPSAVNYFTQKC